MSKPVINETITAADPTKVSGQLRLIAATGGGGVAYTYGGSSVAGIIRVSFDANGALKADDGVTALQLNPNVNTSGSNADAIVSPANTKWELEIRYPGTRNAEIRYISVPDGAGPYQVANILDPAPTDLGATFKFSALADGPVGTPSTGDVPIWNGSHWNPGSPGVTWKTLTTAAQWSAAVTAAMARDDNTLYLAPGNHTLPFPSGRVTATSKLKIQGAGIDVTNITIVPDNVQTFSVTDDHYCFTSSQDVDFEMYDLNVTGPAATDPQGTATCYLYSISQSGSVIVGDTANVTLRFERLRVTDTSGTNFVTIFEVPGGTGLGRVRMYVNDCDLGRCSIAIALFGPDNGDRIAFINRTRFRDSGGKYLTPTYPTFGHTIYVHPCNSIVVKDCQFYNAQKYHLHAFSGGGRSVPNAVPSSFTNCYFGTGGNTYNQDPIVTSSFYNCQFVASGIAYLFGTSDYDTCYFDGGQLTASTNPLRVTNSYFTASVAQGQIASGSDVTVRDSKFTNIAYISAVNSGDKFKFRDCSFASARIALDSTGQIEMYNCKLSGISGLTHITFNSATPTLRLIGCEIDASGYSGEHITGAFAATLSGWGNMVTAGTLNVGATIVQTNLGFVQAGLTPVNSADLVNKGFLGALATLSTVGTSQIANGAVTVAKRGSNPTCFFYRTTNLNVPDSTWTNVPFEVFSVDNLSFYNGVNADRQYLSAEGLYNTTYNVAWANNSIGIRRARLMQHGNSLDLAIAYATDLTASIMPAGQYQYQQVTAEPGVITDLTGYQYLQVWQNSGTTVQLQVQGIDAPIVMTTYMGPT